MTSDATVVHINVIGFPSAVSMAKDPSLRDQAFVVAGTGRGALVLDVSPRARREGLEPGMNLAVAQRRLKALIIRSPEPLDYGKAHREMERIVRRYAPEVENQGGGHLYLDLRGTGRLFGPPADCALRIRDEIVDQLGLDPTIAVARNKITAKVVTRTLRPTGFAFLQPGTEQEFLSGQDLRLLPGIGPSLYKLLHTAGIRSIGALASLTAEEGRALLGPRWQQLVLAARGIGADPVCDSSLQSPALERRLDFEADVADWEALRAATIGLVEDGGMDLRRRRLALGRLGITVLYADGLSRSAALRLRRPIALDQDLILLADRVLRLAADRRVRIRSLEFRFADLVRDPRERDLFEPELTLRQERLQTAVDRSRRRFGPAVLRRATELLAPPAQASVPQGPFHG